MNVLMKHLNIRVDKLDADRTISQHHSKILTTSLMLLVLLNTCCGRNSGHAVVVALMRM